MKTHAVYDNIGKKMVDHNDVVATIEELEQRIADLESKNKILEDRLLKLEQKLLKEG